MRPDDVIRVPAPTAKEKADCRAWLQRFHQAAKSRLPHENREALLTESMLDASGRPIDVMAYFQLDPAGLESIWSNFFGLQHSAQVTGGNQSKGFRPAPWPGYREIWIPIRPDLSLCGQFGSADGDLRVDGTETIAPADCVVILPGLLGHNGVMRSRDIADGLRKHGFHVLSIEYRGHGKVEARYPEVAYNFGALETVDLLLADEWLRRQPYIRRTGLLGFCWGANEALLAAWYDGRSRPHPSITPRVEALLPPVSAEPHFPAGVIGFSPVLRFEEIIEAMKTPRTTWGNPVLASLQDTVLARMELKGYDNPSGNLRKLIEAEYARSALSYPGGVEDGIQFMRFTPFRGLPDGDKLLDARIPALIVQAANDPLAGAQDVADLIARTPNRNVAAVILPGGGHVGFAPYARAYYYSLMVNFFGSQTGPAAVKPARPATRAAAT